MSENSFLYNIENIFDLIHSKIELVGQRCKLWHMPNEELPEACDYIVQDFGQFDIPLDRIKIPICQECSESLSSREWILYYCLKCNQSRWNLMHEVKTEFVRKDMIIQWMKYCPNCYKGE